MGHHAGNLGEALLTTFSLLYSLIYQFGDNFAYFVYGQLSAITVSQYLLTKTPGSTVERLAL
jgi:hypothetical protein